jgi:hypothetical protein
VVQSDFGSRGSEHSGRELFSESANICVHLRLKLLDLIRSSLFVFSEPYLAWDGKNFEPRIAQIAQIGARMIRVFRAFCGSMSAGFSCDSRGSASHALPFRPLGRQQLPPVF